MFCFQIFIIPEPLGPLEIEVSKRDTNSFRVGWGATADPNCLNNGNNQYVVTAKTQADTIAAIDVVPVGMYMVKILIINC